MVARNQVAAPVDDMDEDEVVSTSLTDDEIRALASEEVQLSAGGLTTSRLSENRRSALRYYMGDSYGDEVEGRSQFVSTELRDTVESILPQLLKIFMSTDQVVQYIPGIPEQEQGAFQATEYVNHLFLHKNNGFIILYTMMKDALLFKNGITKQYWDKTTKTTTETYTGLSEQERDSLLADEEVEPTAYTTYTSEMSQDIDPAGFPSPPQQITLCDLTIKRTKTIGRLRVENVPPEEFLIKQRTSTIQESTFVGQRCQKTVTDLVKMGIDKNKAEELAGATGQGEYSLERTQRFVYDGDTSPLSDSGDKSVRMVWVTECYMLIDTDGDGIAERWKITLAGAGDELLHKEEWEGDWPFSSISPYLMPHKFYGLSLYDIVQPYQRLQSTLTRQFLDNIYSLNNNRIAVNADRVNLDDLLTNRPNALVRTIGNPAEVLMPLQPSPLGAVLIPSLEYFNGRQEKSTGVTSYNQGLDADSLNKTASGISQIMGAAQERILLIARIFAETGITDMFRQMLCLVCKHADKAEMVRMRGKWTPVDPRLWSDEMAATTDVALGTNNRDQMLLHLTTVLGIQKEAMQSGMSLVSPKNIYNTLVKLVENTGLKHPETYFTDPDITPPPPPKPTPEEMMAQATMKIEADKNAAKMQETQMKLQAEQAQKTAALQHEKERATLESVDKAQERELKLRIAREANLTTLVTSESKNASADDQNLQKEKTKRKPSRLEVVRDPKTREITGITPIYEEIKDEAAPGPEDFQVGKGKLGI